MDQLVSNHLTLVNFAQFELVFNMPPKSHSARFLSGKPQSSYFWSYSIDQSKLVVHICQKTKQSKNIVACMVCKIRKMEICGIFRILVKVCNRFWQKKKTTNTTHNKKSAAIRKGLLKNGILGHRK